MGVVTPLTKPTPTPLNHGGSKGVNPGGHAHKKRGAITPPSDAPCILYMSTLSISDSMSLYISVSVALSRLTFNCVLKLSGIKSVCKSSNRSVSEYMLRNILSMSLRAYIVLSLYVNTTSRYTLLSSLPMLLTRLHSLVLPWLHTV
jgi:hypothetical protein